MEKYECYWIETGNIRTYLQLRAWLIENNIDAGRCGDHAFPGVVWIHMEVEEMAALRSSLHVNIYDSKGEQLD